MKIYNTSGHLYTLDRDGKRQRVEEFTAPTSDCDCGVTCCGEDTMIRWQFEGKTREIDLNALFDSLDSSVKKEY